VNRRDIEFLKDWKDRKGRKPLVINGARQVGKTWLIKSFGTQYFKKMAYINFEVSQTLKTIFEQGYDVEKIIKGIQIETGVLPDTGTLIVFDEVQLVPAAITSLKYFYENAPQYSVICAGSLLGISLSNQSSFPVGKVEMLDLYPLDFEEFLEAIGQPSLLELIQKHNWDLVKTFKAKYQDLFKQYLYIGGMPEVVAHFAEHQNFEQARGLQKAILRNYELDFSKHAPAAIVPRIRMIWNSVLPQLAKENKKFIYNALRSGARAKDYELALSWLVDAGLVYKVHNLSVPQVPLKAHEDFEVFKLFCLDVGLMAAMADLDVKLLLQGYALLEEFKGALAEQYVLQQLIAQRKSKMYYWSPRTLKSEIDFITENNGKIYPIEVKASENLQAKSLKAFYQHYKPALSYRVSMADYRKESWICNVPLHAVGQLFKLMDNNSGAISST
jgi:uncharacterized protein